MLTFLLEYESKRPPFEDKLRKDADLVNYDACKYTPVFYGKMYEKIQHTDADLSNEFDAALAHPACVGHTFVAESPPEKQADAPEPPCRVSCMLV